MSPHILFLPLPLTILRLTINLSTHILSLPLTLHITHVRTVTVHLHIGLMASTAQMVRGAVRAADARTIMRSGNKMRRSRRPYPFRRMEYSTICRRPTDSSFSATMCRPRTTMYPNARAGATHSSRNPTPNAIATVHRENVARSDGCPPHPLGAKSHFARVESTRRTVTSRTMLMAVCTMTVYHLMMPIPWTQRWKKSLEEVVERRCVSWHALEKHRQRSAGSSSSLASNQILWY